MNVTIRYYRSDGAGPNTYGPYSIGAGQSDAWYLPDVGGLTDGVYSAVVTSDGQSIVGMVNLHVPAVPPYGGDGLMSYDGINR